MNEIIFKAAMEAILNGDAQAAVDAARRGLDAGIDPLSLMDRGFVPGITQVGELFESGQLFIPGLVKSAAAMEKATHLINSAIPEETDALQGRMVVGTVEGDMHDIGKTIVVALLKANGVEVLDLGRDVAVARFIEAAESFGADIIGSSTLLTTTMVVQKELEEALVRNGLKDKYSTVVGGAPVTQRWADRIGADAYAHDANDGVKKVKALLRSAK